MAHTYIKTVNDRKIMQWSLGSVYYIPDKDEWLFESSSLEEIESQKIIL